MVLYITVRWREKGRSRRAITGLLALVATLGAGLIAAAAGLDWAVWVAVACGCLLVIIAFTDAVPEAERGS